MASLVFYKQLKTILVRMFQFQFVVAIVFHGSWQVDQMVVLIVCHVSSVFAEKIQIDLSGCFKQGVFIKRVIGFYITYTAIFVQQIKCSCESVLKTDKLLVSDNFRHLACHVDKSRN